MCFVVTKINFCFQCDPKCLKILKINKEEHSKESFLVPMIAKFSAFECNKSALLSLALGLNYISVLHPLLIIKPRNLQKLLG